MKPHTRELKTIDERARALAQELVLFGHLKGYQWDGLAMFLKAFAENEMKLAGGPPEGVR